MQQYRSTQAKLAETLIEKLGLDGAIHACQANNWDGVLALLQSHGLRNGPATRYRVGTYHY